MTIFKDSHRFSKTLGDVWWQSLKTVFNDNAFFEGTLRGRFREKIKAIFCLILNPLCKNGELLLISTVGFLSSTAYLSRQSSTTSSHLPNPTTLWKIDIAPENGWLGDDPFILGQKAANCSVPGDSSSFNSCQIPSLVSDDQIHSTLLHESPSKTRPPWMNLHICWKFLRIPSARDLGPPGAFLNSSGF